MNAYWGMRGLELGVGVGAGLFGGGSCFLLPPSMPRLAIVLMALVAVLNADIMFDGVRVTFRTKNKQTIKERYIEMRKYAKCVGIYTVNPFCCCCCCCCGCWPPCCKLEGIMGGDGCWYVVDEADGAGGAGRESVPPGACGAWRGAFGLAGRLLVSLFY